jgi:integrase
MEPTPVQRPPAIDVSLICVDDVIDGVLCVHRAPLVGQATWAWRLVWRAGGRQHQRGLGRGEAEDALQRATLAWQAETGEPAARCVQRVCTRVASACTPAPEPAPQAMTRMGQEEGARTSGPLLPEPAAPVLPKPAAAGAAIAEPGPIDGADLTVSALIDAFLRWHAGRPERVRRCSRTLNEYAYRLATLAALIGPVPLDGLTEDLFDQCVETLLDPAFRAVREAAFDAARPAGQTPVPRARGRGYSRATVNQTIQIASIVLRWGRKRGWPVPPVDPNASRLPGQSTPEERVNRSHTPEDEEVKALLADLRQSPLRRASRICWQTGARRAELDGLRWRDIVQRSSGYFIDIGANPDAPGSRKNRQQPVRSVAISAEVYAQLIGERPPEAHDDDAVVPCSDWAQRMVDAQARRGIPPAQQFTPHGLRRRFCSNLLDAGASLGLYADQTGHSPRVAMQVYYRPTDRRRQALQGQVQSLQGGIDLHTVAAELGLTLEEAVRRLRGA